jgi:hypothetical protein
LAPNVWVDRARRLHTTFASIDQVEKEAIRARVQRFVMPHLRVMNSLFRKHLMAQTGVSECINTPMMNTVPAPVANHILDFTCV